MKWLLSDDTPRSLPLAIVLSLVVVILAFAPFLFPDRGSLNTAAIICVFILLAASYDLLLGYTAIISFAHTVFFAIGAYSFALCVKHTDNEYAGMFLGVVVAIAIALVLAFVVSLLSLRVRALFFGMVTLVFFVGVSALVVKASWLTGGEDGVNFSVIKTLRFPSKLFEATGFNINLFSDSFGVFDFVFRGHMLNYYIVFSVSMICFLILLRVANSPFGKVLQGIRENEFRMSAIGFPILNYRIIATLIACVIAAIAGILFALFYGNVSPSAVLDLPVMISILLMTVLGGMGTTYGAVVGCLIVILAERFLKDILALVFGDTNSIPVVGPMLEPANWTLWLGVIYVLAVYFFSEGAVGKLRSWSKHPVTRLTQP